MQILFLPGVQFPQTCVFFFYLKPSRGHCGASFIDPLKRWDMHS